MFGKSVYRQVQCHVWASHYCKQVQEAHELEVHVSKRGWMISKDQEGMKEKSIEFEKW